MKAKVILAFLSLSCLLTIPLSGLTQEKNSDKKKTLAAKIKVLSVETVILSSASVNGKIKVVVTGQVGTPGWSGADLVRTVNPPKDGKIHLDFVATKPSGMSIQVVTPIGAAVTFQGTSGNNVILVHTSTNEKEASIKVQIGDPP
jgi:hypothetical protein